MLKMSLNSTQLDMLTCWQELNYYKTGTTPFTTLPTTPLSKGFNGTLRALLRVECILGLNSRPENANIQISTKDNTNQYINRQSMNARLILVEKKVEQIGKKYIITLYQGCKMGSKSAKLRILIIAHGYRHKSAGICTH